MFCWSHFSVWNSNNVKQMIWIRDTSDFLRKLNKRKYVPNDSHFASFEKLLYTSIPNPEGIKTVKTSIENYQNRRVVKKVIITLLALIPTLNNFIFNNKYLQLTPNNSNNGKLHTNPR